MKINPYLVFNGTCQEAMTFYAEVLGGKVEAMIAFGETPASEHVPAESRDLIMHARIAMGDQVLMASDNHAGMPYEGIRGNSISLQIEKPVEAERVYKALSEGGSVTMPLQETFWAERFGMFTDRFGVPWMVNCEGKKAQHA